MIQDHLLFRARVCADAPAAHTAEATVSFAALLRQVRAVAAALRGRGLPRGSVVMTSVSDKLSDWILTLAIHHEALVSCSNLGYSKVDAFDSDLLITDRAIDQGTASRTWHIDERVVMSLPEPPAQFEPRHFESLDDTIRLFLTSGTTGRRKAVPLSERALLERIKARSLVFEPQHILTPMPLGAAVGYNNALLALLRGRPLYCAQSSETMAMLMDRGTIEGFYGSPAQIASLIQSLSTPAPRPGALQVVKSTGGPISDRLIREVRTRVCPVFVNEYGATETGGVAICLPGEGQDAATVGVPLPGCEVQIVDEYDRMLPRGQEGIVRTRTPYMALGYHQDPEQSARFFLDGFFYPGDRGRLTEDGTLVLAGREVEIINRGGVKIDPAEIDRALLEQPHVTDAAAFGVPGPIGLDEVVAALVVSDTFDATAFRQAVHARLGSTREPKMILRLQSIPRNAAGKVMRQELAETFAKATRQPPSRPV